MVYTDGVVNTHLKRASDSATSPTTHLRTIRLAFPPNLNPLALQKRRLFVFFHIRSNP
jgi:hypothetical protein